MRKNTRQRFKWFFFTITFFLLFPVLQVGLVSFINPPLTTPMLIRLFEGKSSGISFQSNRFEWVDIKIVPEEFLACVWLAEDRHFFNHWGFDWEEIQKARRESKTAGKPARGASTITQQCVRSLFLWQGRSWCRKGVEAYYTVWMELLLPKKRIFELYINVAEFGKGIYGVGAAAQFYYGVPAAKLTDQQAAMLVAILPNPQKWNPLIPDEHLLKHQAIILEISKQINLPIEKLR